MELKEANLVLTYLYNHIKEKEDYITKDLVLEGIQTAIFYLETLLKIQEQIEPFKRLARLLDDKVNEAGLAGEEDFYPVSFYRNEEKGD